MQSLDLQVIAMRRKDFMREAQQYRLHKLATAYHRGMFVRFMDWTGRRLVAAGESLQVRAVAPVVASDPCH